MEYLHTMVRVTDLDASLDFYCNKLGMTEIRRRDSENGRFTLVFLAAGPDGLEPFELPAPGRARALPPPELPGLDADATPPR